MELTSFGSISTDLSSIAAGQDLPPKYEDVVLMPPVIAATDNNNSTANSTSQNPRLERY